MVSYTTYCDFDTCDPQTSRNNSCGHLYTPDAYEWYENCVPWSSGIPRTIFRPHV